MAGKIPTSKLERAALTSIFIEMRDKNQQKELGELHRKIWTSNDNQGYYDFTSDRLQKMFEQLKDSIYTTISRQLKENSYHELIELGCGEGIVVNTLSKDFLEINSFLGVDINRAQIEINKATYSSNEKLSFETGDLTKDVDLIKGPNKIYLTFGGVLEYLSEQELLGFLQKLSVLENILIILYEPIEPGFAIYEEQHSILYGSEISFSHPYPYYFSQLGIEIVDEKLINSQTRSFLYLAAKTN